MTEGGTSIWGADRFNFASFFFVEMFKSTFLPLFSLRFGLTEVERTRIYSTSLIWSLESPPTPHYKSWFK